MNDIKNQLNAPETWTVTNEFPQVGKIVSMNEENFKQLLEMAKSFLAMKDMIERSVKGGKF